MAAESDPDRPAGRQVIEPTAIFPATPEYDDAPDGPVEGWMEELDLFRPPGTELPPEAPTMADDDTQEMTGGPPPPTPGPAGGTGRAPATARTARTGRAAPQRRPAGAGRTRRGVVLSLVVMVDRDSASGAAEAARRPHRPRPPRPRPPARRRRRAPPPRRTRTTNCRRRATRAMC
ncbi:hypothetical protein [Streptomyces rapamycinicus]|uniref:hypothetical protein n=1 Tax=Streptomyces rapamycinicus TaxID=1226757 RepID=UPI0032D90590